MNFNEKSFEISALVHPSTYINKVLFGSKQGSLIYTTSLIYTMNINELFNLTLKYHKL